MVCSSSCHYKSLPSHAIAPSTAIICKPSYLLAGFGFVGPSTADQTASLRWPLHLHGDCIAAIAIACPAICCSTRLFHFAFRPDPKAFSSFLDSVHPEFSNSRVFYSCGT